MNASTIKTLGAQCPQCGHQGIVEYEPKVYACLKCDFEKDFTLSPESKKKGAPGVLVGGAGLFLLLLLLL